MPERKRDRYQVIVALGEGAEGAERRRVIAKAAREADKTVSAWVRHVVCVSLGLPLDEAVTRTEFEKLALRVAALEGENNGS